MIKLSEEAKVVLQKNIDIWEGYVSSLTLNTAQVGVHEIKSVWESEVEPLTGEKWEAGCSSCIIQKLTRLYRALENQKVEPVIEANEKSTKKRTRKNS